METAQNLREMSDEQLELTLKDAREQLFRLRIKRQTENLSATSQMQKYRRLVARVKTVQRQRELQQTAQNS